MTNGKKIIIVFAMIMILIMPPAGVENVLAEDNDNSAQETVLAADEYAEQQNETELQNEPETSQLPENDSSDTEANPSADYTVQADEDEIKASDEGTVEEPPAEDTSDSISKETGAVEQNESGEPEEVTDEKLQSIVEYELIPMLKEYWFDEPLKVKEWSDNLRSAVK